MQCDARSTANQGEAEGVDLCPRLKMSPKICQEIAHNAPPLVFFTKNEAIPKNFLISPLDKYFLPDYIKCVDRKIKRKTF